MLEKLDKLPRRLCEETYTPGGMTVGGGKVWEQSEAGRHVTAAMESILRRVEEVGKK